MQTQVIHDFSLLGDQDLHLFNEGRHYRLHEKFGAHEVVVDGVPGVNFVVWAPNAQGVSVTGDFNDWNRESHPLRPRGSSGIWEGFVPGAAAGARYKYHIPSRFLGYRVDKADPFAFFAERPPRTASIVANLDYEWGDAEWMRTRHTRNSLNAPISIYEVHLDSWKRVGQSGERPLSYLEMADSFVDYVAKMGFTHVELMPILEHPYTGSWGYQCTGYFAATSRYGSPTEFMHLIDRLHQAGIGVILDWVPSHFPTDEHGLAYFDGTHLYEHADPRQGFHRDWTSLIFNYGRNEVKSFLISSALFWLEKYHIDALRVDAVASMLYLDYSRPEGEWVANPHGGRENLEAIAFLRELNTEAYRTFPDIQMIAEESTAWPMVSRPIYLGGLGFGLKWDMGWMHDTLHYMERDPVHRKYHHNQLTFRQIYAGNENFVLPLSHDEVVYGKQSLLTKMPGDEWQRFANLRLLFGYMFAQDGKKLIFMGGEFGQWQEWIWNGSLEWGALDYPMHSGVQRWVRDLNFAYRENKAFFERDCTPGGFEWIDGGDTEQSVVTFLRQGEGADEAVLAALNFTPTPRHAYRIGAPRGGFWRELLNSDAEIYGGSGQGNFGGVTAQPVPIHGRPYSVPVTLPPLGAVFFKWEESR